MKKIGELASKPPWLSGKASGHEPRGNERSVVQGSQGKH